MMFSNVAGNRSFSTWWWFVDVSLCFPSCETSLLPTSLAGSVFMCRLCNLFSPSHTQLLAHCSQLHAEQEPPDDIIIVLQPLAGESVETLAGHNYHQKVMFLYPFKYRLKSLWHCLLLWCNGLRFNYQSIIISVVLHWTQAPSSASPHMVYFQDNLNAF